MATAGIVAEYNPFHRGHAWHIAWTRQTLGADTAVICVMSGHWVQRGECALTDKWSRAALALSGGADLVLELPTPWAMASAESFARGAVGLLAATGVVDVLSFGSETGELAPLRAAAAALDGPDYPERLRAGLARGLSFPAARQAAVGADCLASPNDNLGVEYLRALPPGMEALTIPRRGAAHDGPAAGGFASASELRALLRAGRAAEADPYLTAPWSGETASMAHIDRAVLARLRMMDEADWAALPDGGAAEGLPARLARSARTADSLEDFYARAKTKRYPHARLRYRIRWLTIWRPCWCKRATGGWMWILNMSTPRMRGPMPHFWAASQSGSIPWAIRLSPPWPPKLPPISLEHCMRATTSPPSVRRSIRYSL